MAGSGQAPLDPEKLKAALRTITIEDDNYVLFVVTLVDQGRLTRVVVDTAFRWARDKTDRRFQYFKRAVIAHADRVGITLPSDTPPQRAPIRGRVVQRVLLVNVPVPFVEVQIAGTSIKTRTDLEGEFTLPDQLWGTYTIEAHGGAAQLFRTISAVVKLPFLPDDATSLTLVFR